MIQSPNIDIISVSETFDKATKMITYDLYVRGNFCNCTVLWNKLLRKKQLKSRISPLKPWISIYRPWWASVHFQKAAFEPNNVSVSHYINLRAYENFSSVWTEKKEKDLKNNFFKVFTINIFFNIPKYLLFCILCLNSFSLIRLFLSLLLLLPSHTSLCPKSSKKVQTVH